MNEEEGQGNYTANKRHDEEVPDEPARPQHPLGTRKRYLFYLNFIPTDYYRERRRRPAGSTTPPLSNARGPHHTTHHHPPPPTTTSRVTPHPLTTTLPHQTRAGCLTHHPLASNSRTVPAKVN